jgi:hypothetical protein
MYQIAITLINVWVPYTAENFLIRLATISFLRNTVVFGVSSYINVIHKLFVLILLSCNAFRYFVSSSI